MIIEHNHLRHHLDIEDPNCPRCKLNEAAPDLLAACKEAELQLQNVIIPMGGQKHGTPLNKTIRKVQGAIELAEKS